MASGAKQHHEDGSYNPQLKVKAPRFGSIRPIEGRFQLVPKGAALVLDMHSTLLIPTYTGNPAGGGALCHSFVI